MKIRTMKFFLLSAFVSLMIFACQSNQSAQSNLPEGVNKVEVKEVIQTSNYTYLLVKENGTEKWIAVDKMEANPGETYYYTGSFEMTDFESKELERTFASIYFIEKLGSSPEIFVEKPVMDPHSTGRPKVDQLEITVEPVEGGITIAELYSGKDSYAGKKVKITGQVTKFNEAIMKKNWIHLQDGTNFSGKYDLTATTESVTEVGDIITIEGTLSLDKDFGYGYAYEVLVEDAVVIISR